MTLNDETEIVHSDMLPDGRVKVYIERPRDYGFDDATCYLPDYEWTDVHGFTEEDISKYNEIIESTAHIIIELSKEGGFDNAPPIQD